MDDFHGINLTGRGLRGVKGDVGDVNPQMPIILAEARAARDEAEQAALDAAVSATTAESAAGPTYPDTATGLAATSDGEAFAVDNGDGTVTVWLNDGGVAVEQRTLATTDALASTDPGEGAAMVGLDQGGTVQQAIRYITPQMRGAVGDWDGSSGTDDTAAFQMAIDEAVAKGLGLAIPHGQYRITSPLIIDSAITIVSDGAHLMYDSNDAGVALTVSQGSSGNLLSRPRILGHLVLEKVAADWGVECHGVKLQNCYMGEFHLSVLKFNRGIWLHSDGTGCVYNDIHVSQLTNNKYSTYLDTATSLGWTNHNTFWGGRYSNGIQDAGSHIEIDDSLYQINGNSWVRSSLEAVSPTYMLFNLQGSQNCILHPRCEHGGAPTHYGELGGTKNEITAHSSPYLTETRVNITGTLYKLDTSVGSRRSFQGGYRLERQGAGAALSLQPLTHEEEAIFEILGTTGNRLIGIPAVGPWEVYNGKKVLWRSTAAPSTGTWTRGDTAWMTNPVAGGPAGWICTAPGTPGTWAPFGQMGAALSIGSAPLFVGQLAVAGGNGYIAVGIASSADWKQITA